MATNREELLSDLNIKLGILTAKYKNLLTLEDAINTLKAENKQLQEKYNNLLIAKSISANSQEIKMMKKNITQMIRDIDKCVAMLSLEINN